MQIQMTDAVTDIQTIEIEYSTAECRIYQTAHNQPKLSNNTAVQDGQLLLKGKNHENIRQ